MITAEQAREMIVKSDFNSARVLATYITKRIEELVTLSCKRGMNQVNYNAFFTIQEEKNELTKRDACENVISELKRLGYQVDINKYEFTVKW